MTLHLGDILDPAQTALLETVIARRNPALSKRIQRRNKVCRSDAEQIVDALGRELTDNLDAEWA